MNSVSCGLLHVTSVLGILLVHSSGLLYFIVALLVHICVAHGFLLDSTSDKKVQVLLTTGDQSRKLSHGPDLFPTTSNGGGQHINVNRNTKYQRMEGFGAAVSNSAAYVIYHSPKRHEIMKQLFSPVDGIGVSYIRITMGGSDLQAVPPYTYDDLPNGVSTDFNMQHFSIDKDREFFLPIIKEAVSINPKLRILGSPWSAPAWMKSSNSLYGGDFHYDPDGKYQQALSLYFVKFIQAYKAEGIDITAITIQNEPMYQTSGYPTMTMSWQIQRDLVKWHMGPLFLENHIYTKILIFDHNWQDFSYPENILKDHFASQYVSGVAWHCYGGDKSEPGNFQTKFPDVDQYFTECSGFTQYPVFRDNLMYNMDKLFIGQPRNWVKAVMLWNIALDQNQGPRVNVHGCNNCRGVVTVHTNSDQYDKEVEYYSIGHFSKVVQPGAMRIDSNEVRGLQTVAFENPDRTIALIVSNPSDQTNSFNFDIDGSTYHYSLPAKSVVSFLYSTSQ